MPTITFAPICPFAASQFCGLLFHINANVCLGLSQKMCPRSQTHLIQSSWCDPTTLLKNWPHPSGVQPATFFQPRTPPIDKFYLYMCIFHPSTGRLDVNRFFGLWRFKNNGQKWTGVGRKMVGQCNLWIKIDFFAQIGSFFLQFLFLWYPVRLRVAWEAGGQPAVVFQPAQLSSL